MCGRPEVVIPGKDNTIVSVGTMAQVALESASILKTGNIEAAVFNIRTAKPLDEQALRKMFKPYSSILTLEDGTINGGIGMRIASALAQSDYPPTVLNLGWPDEFIPHGKISELHKKYGLDSLSVAKKAEAFFEKKT